MFESFAIIALVAVIGLFAGWLLALLGEGKNLNDQIETIMDTLQDLNTRLEGIEGTLTKIGTESAANVAELKLLREQIANTPLPADALATLGRIEARAKVIDDLTPDAPPAPPAPPAE